MKIVFINISLRPESIRRQLPVGLGYVMTACKRAGYGFDLIDMDIDNLDVEAVYKILEERQYDVVAFGCIVSGYKYAKAVAKASRLANPKSVVVAGNSVASAIPEILLSDTDVDIAVLGGGDDVIVDILNAVKNKKDYSDVAGIAYKRDGSIYYTEKRALESKIDRFGFPEWELFNLEKYNEYGNINGNNFTGEIVRLYPLNSGRGCPYRCTFCYITVRDEKKRYRRYSTDAIIGEMNRLHYKYGANYISFWDDLAFPNKRSIETMTEQILKLDYKIYWDAPVRGDLFKEDDEELLDAIRRSGCDNLGFSLENADEEILKAIDKHLDVNQFIRQCLALHKARVTPLTSVIFGYPQESVETIQKTLDVCEEAKVYPSVGFLLPLPGAKVYEDAKRDGKIGDEIAYLERIGDRQDFHINLTSMPDDYFVSEVNSRLMKLAKKLGLEFKNPFKTGTYQAVVKK